MALTGRKVQRGGWQQQAERLALNHTAVPTTTMAATEQALHRTISNSASCDRRTGGTEFQHRLEARIFEFELELGPEPNSPRPRFVDQEQRVARPAAAAWLLNGRRETLAARAARTASADKRVAELENELGLSRERLILEENENCSLQLSLDLTTSENSRLSSQLAENERQVRKLEQLHAKLIDDMNILLMTCKRRDAALTRAEERLSSLADLFVQLEAANFSKSQLTRGDNTFQPIHELDIDKWPIAETNTVCKNST
jgi:hypothetical protein